MYVCWVPSDECNIEYKNIFDINNFSYIDLKQLDESKYAYFGRVHTQNIMNKILDVYNNKDDTYNFILLEGGHEFISPDITRLQFLYLKSSLFKI